VARHQAHEVAVHTYDAQSAVGVAEPLPTGPAVDGVEEFMLAVCSTTTPWPHPAAAIEWRSTEGPAWRLTLDGKGAWAQRLDGTPAEAASVTATASAGELLLWAHNRIELPEGGLQGDAQVVELLREWDPDA
jgi:hypothetical protein